MVERKRAFGASVRFSYRRSPPRPGLKCAGSPGRRHGASYPVPESRLALGFAAANFSPDALYLDGIPASATVRRVLTIAYDRFGGYHH